MSRDEQAIIGAALLLGDKHSGINLDPADFESDFFAAVWKRMQQMREIDHTALESEFIENRSLLSECATTLPSHCNMEKIGKRIKEAAHRRRVKRCLVDAHRMIEAGEDISAVGDIVTKALDGIAVDNEWKPLADYLLPAYRDMERAQINGEDCNFLPTGFVTFDSEFGGLQKDGLIVVAGRPGMGKSALAAQLARVAADRGDVLIQSMEMSGKQLAMRFYASEAGVCMQRMMQGRLTNTDWGLMAGIQEQLCESGIFINQNRSRSLTDIESEARRFKRCRKNPAMIVVDYLTLIDLPTANTKSDSIAETTRRLVCLAGDIGCPIVLLAQLNRDCEKRADKTPIMSDLGDSGAIERDAHQILFPFRPEVYDKKPDNIGAAILKMGKNRNGATGSVKLKWVGESAKFEDLKDEY